ncbi:PspC domain-containing protein [Arthrobacter sp. M4]|uniref:PspC domain-containing protein n=1 Tax=Arthrobacter sp. M4 TaxID=218160 RepID=UPI001CDBFABE|nr:PspC domain-containing protein [Arthrobacter sp. M4]MCA4132866.1 PspC domain-containing protein [Arthrobacter sp. M4]
MNPNSVNSNDDKGEEPVGAEAAAGAGTRAGAEAAAGAGTPAGAEAGSSYAGAPSDAGASGYAPSDSAQRGPAPSEARQNFFDWIRSHGVYRGPDRWVGGVASGIAHRVGIDPLIVRGIFIVLALFAGIGVLLYGVAWAFLPEPDGRIHVQEAGAGRWTAGMTGAVITSIIGLPGLGRGFWGWGWNDGAAGIFWALVWTSLIAFFIYYLIQRSRNRNGAPRMNPPYPGGPYAGGPAYAGEADTSHAYGATAYGAPDASTGSAGENPTSPNTSAFSSTGTIPSGSGTGRGPRMNAPVPPYLPPGPVPPSGGFPGAGVPSHPHPRRTGPGAAIVAVAAGAALVTGGTIKALDAGNVIQLGDATNAVVWASGAAVLGLGIVIAGLRGRSSGFMSFLAIVALLVGTFFNFVPRGDRFAFHDADWAPVSIQQAQSGFEVTGGRSTVDLRSMGLATPLSSDVVVPVDVTASNVTVIIPNTVPVEIRADMAFGNLNQGSDRRGGQFSDARTQYNTDKSGAKLVVKINGAFSNVTIQEGN